MKISRTKLAFAAVLLTGTATAVYAQQDSPESILPPGFDNPAPAPAPAPRPAPAPAPSIPSDSSTSAPVGDAMTNTAAIEDQPTAPVDLSKYELPEQARHGLGRIGISVLGNPAFPANAFGASNGKYLATMMRRIDAPIASRWVSIALRRALQSRINTPKSYDGADFAAERAWLLLRMGESIAARGVVQDVDVENYTPLMFEVAMQSALASADPGALCGIAEPGSKRLPERGWAFAKAMCAGLAGDPSRAGQLFDQAAGGRQNIDTLVAEKVMGAGAQGRRAVTIEWDGVTTLTAWRWGLATATGVEVPAELYRSAGPQVTSWLALAPGPSSAARANAAELAATQGVFSEQGLVELYGEIETEDGADSAAVAVARDLRTAHTGANMADRIAALQRLWNNTESQRLRYARLVLTGRASASIPVSSDRSGEADQLIASMLSAGLDSQAMAWRPVVKRGSDGWAMLALADPAANAVVSSADFESYRGSADRRKAQLAFAGLAGMGRLANGDVITLAGTLGVDVRGENAWTRAIDAAGRRGESGTVILLAAAGLQARGWAPVSPEALYHIISAMRAAGLGNYARMVAVEAITRV
ncbi:hypothetical protein OF829_20115 [Sphingomonas sp. LB-2]|uniref:hypothetical protein n=1 Tax=Sphingomonas caeni TaxID=2984949 RepID=UPI00222F8FA0|nr:hypothetical protein [Sphingomonas caeni]MCW3849549.1 hypothetical protein [Sphingomonas caeni]